MLFLNIQTLSVYFDGKGGDQYMELIEFMANQINSISSHCSRWIFDRIELLQVSFIALSPEEAGSFLD